LTSSTFCTASSASRKEIAPGTQVRKARTQSRKFDDAGFTLIELLVTMIVVSILSMALASFIVNWLQAASLSQDRTNLLSNAQSALDSVSTDIQLSGDADQNNRWPDANAPGGQFGWQSNSQTLILAKAATDSQNNIIFSDPAKYISQKDNQIYYLSGSTLYRRTLASSDATDSAVTTCPTAAATASCPADLAVASGVTNFAVTYYDAAGLTSAPTDARSVQLAITLATTLNGKTISASYNTRMVFRNE
ncbi:MAG: type II secretion system protein, partial [Candidatus Saccharimonadales bacterium]